MSQVLLQDGRFFLFGVLTFASIAKLANLRELAAVVYALGLGVQASQVLAGLVVVVEGGAAVLLLTLLRAGALATALLLLAFSAAAEVARRRAVSVNCACFGAASATRFGRATTLRNIPLIAIAATLIAAGGGGGLSLPAALAGLLAALTLVFLEHVLRQISSNSESVREVAPMEVS